MFRRTRFGVGVFAIGNDEEAARAHGTPVRRIKVGAYIVSGVFAACGGLFFAATTTAGDATSGDVFILTSIAAVVLGGISFFGGRGSAIGTVAGAFILTLLTNVLFFASIDPLYQSFFQGLFLIVAVLLGTLVRRARGDARMSSQAELPEQESRRRQVGRRLTPDRRRVLYAFAAAVLVFVVGELVHKGFASPASVKAILVIASFVGFVTAGQTFVILIGGIDLSVPWVLNAAAILLVTSSLGRDGRVVPAVLLSLGLGLTTGLVNGIGIAYLAVPAVVMTLGMNGIMEGLTLGASSGLTCNSCASYAPKTLQNVVNSNVARRAGRGLCSGSGSRCSSRSS